MGTTRYLVCLQIQSINQRRSNTKSILHDIEMKIKSNRKRFIIVIQTQYRSLRQR